MTPRERVIAALNHQKADKVPCEVRCTIQMREELFRFSKSSDFISGYIEPIISRVELEEPGTWIKDGYYRDCFGVVWNRLIDRDYGVVEVYPATIENFRKYTFPSPLSDAFLDNAKRHLAVTADHLYRLARLNLSLWERAWTLVGMENLMIAMATAPDAAAEIFRRIGDYNCEVLGRVLKHLDIDGVHFGDDWGTQTNLQMSPEMWRMFIKPHLKRMYEMVRNADKFVSIHSCGRVQSLFDELIELGVNSFNPFQPEVMDTEELLRTYKGKLCFWGGISTQTLLPYETPEVVFCQTKRLIDRGRDGGLIVTPAHSIPAGTPPKNIVAMLEAMRDHAANR